MVVRKSFLRASVVFLVCLYLLFNVGCILVGMMMRSSYGNNECHFNEVNITHFVTPGYHLGCWILED